jgi:cytochrome bd-type quinol oxidase subunit 2
MIKKIRNIALTLATVAFAALPAIAVPAVAFAAGVSSTNITDNLCSGTNFDISGGSSTTCDTPTNQDNLNNLLSRIVNVFSVIVGVIAVVMIIAGGLRYITSGGESNKVGSAKTTIIYALVGLVVVAIAQLIVHFVLSKSSNLTGA